MNYCTGFADNLKEYLQTIQHKGLREEDEELLQGIAGSVQFLCSKVATKEEKFEEEQPAEPISSNH